VQLVGPVNEHGTATQLDPVVARRYTRYPAWSGLTGLGADQDRLTVFLFLDRVAVRLVGPLGGVVSRMMLSEEGEPGTFAAP
jgi:hypothetical protein